MADGEDELAQSLRELQTIQRVAEDVISSRDLDDVLSRCIDHTRELARTPSGAIYLRDERRGIFDRLVARETLNDQAHLPIEQIDAALTGRNYFVADLDNPAISWHPAVTVARARGFRVSLNLGMRWRGQLLGLLVLAWREPITIPDSTLRTLDALMGYLAAAIENARTLALLQLRARLAQALRDFAGRALTTTDESGLHLLVVEAAGAIAQTGRAGLATIEGERLTLRTQPALPLADGLTVADPLIGEALARAEPLLVENLETTVGSPLAAAAIAAGCRSLALVPLERSGAAHHLLLVGRDQPGRWHFEEAEALQTLSAVASDALERARIQLNGEHERRRLDATLEHLPIGVVVVDGSGRVLHNNRASTALGTLMGTLGGDYADGLRKVRRPDGSRFEQIGDSIVGQALQGHLPPPRDVHLLDASGVERVIRAVAAPLNEPGQPPVAVMGFYEVTELFQLAEAKDRFLRIASHELRSPVTALRATAQLLTLDPSVASDPERRQLLHERIERQSERLARLVAQLLDSTRLQAEALPLEREDMDLTALAREVADEAGARVQLVAAQPVRGHWDRSRVEQVLNNLLSNALQYSSADTPVVLSVSDGGGHARIEVSDRGSGLTGDQLAQLFTPFYRPSHSSGRHKGGMGLGLHITSEIVRRHGGTIRVESQPDVGSTFTVELPR